MLQSFIDQLHDVAHYEVLAGALDAVSSASSYLLPDAMLKRDRRAFGGAKEGAAGKCCLFVLLVEGAAHDEERAGEGFWCIVGEEGSKTTRRAVDSTSSLRRPHVVVAVGSCAIYGDARRPGSLGGQE
ncbi:MAG: hypothetical protein QXU97_00340 [Fervidicoccaceae archaeon]